MDAPLSPLGPSRASWLLFVFLPLSVACGSPAGGEGSGGSTGRGDSTSTGSETATGTTLSSGDATSADGTTTSSGPDRAEGACAGGGCPDGRLGAICAWGERRMGEALPEPAPCQAGLVCCAAGGAAGSDSTCHDVGRGGCPAYP